MTAYSNFSMTLLRLALIGAVLVFGLGGLGSGTLQARSTPAQIQMP